MIGLLELMVLLIKRQYLMVDIYWKSYSFMLRRTSVCYLRNENQGSEESLIIDRKIQDGVYFRTSKLI